MAKLRDRSNFLFKYNISVEDFNETTIEWTELEEIYKIYNLLVPTLESIGEMLSNQLMKLEKVHSTRYRIKDAEHLIAKMIRKRITDPARIITKDNFTSEITDLVGLRAIHLFKEDWLAIHKSIINGWDLRENPKAYIRTGDNQNYQEAFSNHGCTVATHKRGYRSIHYIIQTKPAKVEYYAEIQVRTIFEEGWSEIDHTISYPYDLDNLLFKEFLSILNRLAGSADEMGSFIKLLRKEIWTKESKILDLQEEIDKLKISETEKIKLKENVAEATRPFSYENLDLNKLAEKLSKEPFTGRLRSTRFASGLEPTSDQILDALKRNFQ